MTIQILSGGAWQTPTDIQMVVGGAWTRIQEIRVLDAGAWQTAFVYDTTGPGPVTNFKAEWSNTSGNQIIVSFTNPTDVDFDHTDLYVNRSGSSTGPWTLVGTYTGATASYTEGSVTIGTLTGTYGPNYVGSVYYFKTVSYDIRGNNTAANDSVKGSTGKNQTVVRGMYTNPFYVNPTDSHTWNGTAWLTTGATAAVDSTGLPERVIQGYYTNTTPNYGFYFYNGFPTGINTTSATLRLIRQNGGTGGGISAYLRASAAPQSLVTAGSNPTGYTYTGATLGPALATPANGGTRLGDATIPNAWITGFQAGTYKSVLLYTAETSAAPSANYAVWDSKNEENAFGVAPGFIAIYHTG